MKKVCDICGLEFEPRNEFDNVCVDCRFDRYKAVPMKEPTPVEAANQKIVEDVREATRLGLSYGVYKGRGKYEGKKL